MYILGLNVGHNATACLLKDGKITGCVQEERFSRIKNHSGIPFNAINSLLKENKITTKDIDLIVSEDHYPVIEDPDFGKKFLEDYTHKRFHKKILSGIGYRYPRFFEKYLRIKEIKKDTIKKRQKIRGQLSKKLNFPEKKIVITDHHICHALSAGFNVDRNKKTLIFTLDGEGSDICATVNIFDGKKLTTISKTKKDASLGYLYAIVTIFLGMKPLQHEFKVMGMAPYAKEHNIEKAYSKLKDLIEINDSLMFHSRFNMPFSDIFLEKELKYERFDNICGAIQKLVEEKTCEWVKKSIKKTGINSIALSGGVFMNVKANQRIAELPEVNEIFVMPSCGDECNAIGACFYGYRLYCERNNLQFAPFPIKDLYLGPEYDEGYIKRMISENNLKKKYSIIRLKNPNKEVARLLSRGEIVARCSGKSEWGARALGNRSILANPSHKETIRILNETIKDRDFWMPFTPSILDKFEKKYIKNPKNIFAPYMVITFDSTEKGREELIAAIHPYDFTIRPQIVTKKYNRDYYEIIEEFYKLTGIGGVLNTSFNLHGEPNVLTPEDSLHTLDNSDLKYLVVGEYLFQKKEL